MIEEEHVSQYESLKDPSATWLEDLLMHEYTECYLYYSCMMTECDLYIRKIWEECLMQEISHLHKAKELLEKYENKSWQQVIGGCGDFSAQISTISVISLLQQPATHRKKKTSSHLTVFLKMIRFSIISTL